MKKMSQHVAFWKKMLYFPPEKEIRVKTISALFTYRTQSRLHSIFFSVLLLRDSFMWMGFITLQQTSGVLLFKLKFQAHFLVVSHTWEFIFLPSGTCFHFLSFFFFFLWLPSCLFKFKLSLSVLGYSCSRLTPHRQRAHLLITQWEA